MILSQILINLGIYGGIPLLLLITAYFFGHSSASRQADLNELESKIEQQKKIDSAEQKNQLLEGQKNEELKKLNNISNSDELISLFKSLFIKK